MPAGVDSIVDEIYEAAFIPEKWPRVLNLVGEAAGGTGGEIFLAAQAKSHFVISEHLLPIWEDCVKAGVMELSNNPRATRMLAKNHPGFITELDIVTMDEMNSLPMYVQGLRPAGYGWGAGSFVPLVNGDTLVFSFEKRFDAGPVTAEAVATLDGLRPHLARAGVISARVSFERVKAALSSLGEIGLPALAIDSGCRQLAENQLVSELRPYLSYGAFNNIQFKDKKADDLFRAAILTINRDQGESRSFVATTDEQTQPAIVHVLPVRKNAHDIFAKAAAIVVGNIPHSARHPNADVLNSILDLTPAQSRVARMLLTGKSLQAAALELGVSRETAKTHLNAVFAKTGTRRQADLIVLLSALLTKRVQETGAS